MPDANLILGDCLDVLRGMADASVDAVVTDPPAGIKFMGKQWDTPGSFVERQPDRTVVFDKVAGNHNPSNPFDKARTAVSERAKFVAFLTPRLAECLRVAKPGARMLCWAIPRTSHWTGTAIEDAGWIIEDRVSHFFGTGFPKHKSKLKPACEDWWMAWKPDRKATPLNIDATRIRASSDASRPTVAGSPEGVRDALQRIASELRSCSTCGIGPLHGGADRDGMSPCPARCGETLRALRSNAPEHASSWNEAQGSPGDCPSCRHSCDGRLRAVRGAARESAASLADALERICREQPGPQHSPNCQCTGHPSTWDAPTRLMAFLTLVLPVNHVDELYSLAGRNQGRDGEASADRRYTDRGSSNFAAKPGPRGGDSLGRWPANVVLDEEAARLLDEQTGELKGGVAVNRNREPGTMTSWYGKRASQTGEDVGYGDTGGASRFYYCPKASKADRGDGNTHPTVKNTDLMRWLIRLITPPGGAVLDPFAGSGSTGKAAVLEGMSFVGIEQSPEYHAIASGRIAAARAALLPLAEAV